MTIYPRTYEPQFADADGSNVTLIPRPVNVWKLRLGRRQHKGLIARRDGGYAYLDGKKDVMYISIGGVIGDPDTGISQEAIDDFERVLNYEGEFRLFKYTDRYAKVRWTREELPGTRVIIDEHMQSWRLELMSLDPYWYDTTSCEVSEDVNFPFDTEHVLHIEGNAPTPLEIWAVLPPDCTTICQLRWEDVAGQAADGKHYGAWGADGTCLEAGWTLHINNAEQTLEVGDLTSGVFETFVGYFFVSGPGDTTIAWSAPLNPDTSCSVSITYKWKPRWHNP